VPAAVPVSHAGNKPPPLPREREISSGFNRPQMGAVPADYADQVVPLDEKERKGLLERAVGWLEDKAINLGQGSDLARRWMSAVLDPVADSLRSMDDPHRNPQVANFRRNMLAIKDSAIEGWRRAGEGFSALADYTMSAMRERRWSDVGRAIRGWQNIGLQSAWETTKAQAKAVALVAWGLVTTPYRLVTQSIPNFYRAVKERQEGKDRAWDVIFTGVMLEGDIAATYGLGKAAISGATKARAAWQARSRSSGATGALVEGASSEEAIASGPRQFLEEESSLARYLTREGRRVEPLPEDHSMGVRQPDALVDSIPTEFKSVRPGASSSTIRNAVNDSIKGGGQARNIIIDARGSGLTLAEAQRGLLRARGIAKGKLDSIRIIGDDFDISISIE
jgi:hypothetical protein